MPSESESQAARTPADWHDGSRWADASYARYCLGVDPVAFLGLLDAGRLHPHHHGGETRFRVDDLNELARSLEAEREAEIARRIEAGLDLVTMGWVYFVEAAEVGRIKIGYSDKPSIRAGGMLTGCPVDLEVIGVLRGTKGIERRIQRGFSSIRWKREWFRGDARLRAFVAEFGSDPSAATVIPVPRMREQEAEALVAATTKSIAAWFSANP